MESRANDPKDDPNATDEWSDGSGPTEGDDPDDASGADSSAILEAFHAKGATVVTSGVDRTDVEPTAGADGDSAAGTDRGRRLYDRWSGKERLYDGLMGLAAPLRDDAFDALSIESGESVLDLACGPGTNFERLREAVGPEGTIIGLDYSPGMARRAAELVDERGWENVHVVLADAAETCGPESSFDAVLTTFALHTMPDADAVVENVHDVLGSGGRFVVLDSRPITDGPARLVNPLYERAIARFVNHQRGRDTLELLDAPFDRVTVLETYDAGAGYLAVTEKRDGE
ncbi:class I SAM-dependent methyltransferase [Halovivax sp.]|uniref:class I SAM-dependent methyltransferase n=1 Tax=Halovivax sp. TaxID=1935978 RepID=UPI0025C23703|nr:methyltransferase domain-containing protein [Halovivax sp.]